MTVELDAEQQLILAGANPAVISTVDHEGEPVSVVTWYLFEAPDRLVLSIDTQSSRGDRLAHLRRQGRFALTVMDAANWLHSVTVLAEADDFTDDVDLELIDRMATLHGLDSYAKREPRTAVRARIRDVLI